MLNLFESHLRADLDLSPKTIRAYLSDLRDFTQWYERWANQPFSLSHIATPTLTRYRAALTERLKPASINRRIVSLKQFFAWAATEGLIERDPAKAIRQVKDVPPPPRHITDQEEAALISAVSKYGTNRDLAMITLMLHTGIRTAELCDLTQPDVKIAPRSGSITIRQGKGGKRREIPLNITARTALSAHLQELPADSHYLFPGRNKKRLSERAVGYIVTKFAYLAKVKDISPHDLRHRFGYRMAENTPIHRLAQLMGHDSVDTTLLYIGATAQDLQSEVDKIAWE